MRALHDDGASHTRIQYSEISLFLAAAMLLCRPHAREGWREAPMADVHGERALLNHCDANGLSLSTPARARTAPCARAA